MTDSARTLSAAGSEPGGGVARVFQITVAASPSLAEAIVVTCDARPVTIGRAPPETSRGLALDDDQTSRSHAEVRWSPADDAYEVIDLDSRNGVFVDGEKADRALLRHGTVVRLGRSLLVCSDCILREDESLVPEWPTLRGIGLSMQRLRGEISRVAPHAIPVLVLGETGTGKELVAGDIHRLSGRPGPFVAINCAAIPEALAESELFGHVAGAYTGATQRTEGVFASAHRGTLFLDEVAELPAAVQAKLLRVLATGEVRALGRSEPSRVDVRIVAATHRDVAREDGFRSDLLARLSGWTLRVPPLRERREDVLWLARVFAERASPPASIATGAAEALLLHAWPRNVRELEMAIATASIRAGDRRVIQTAHLPEGVGASLSKRPVPPHSAPPIALLVPRDSAPSGADLQLVLDHFSGSIARVAEYFGKDRKQVYRWLERAGIDPGSLR